MTRIELVEIERDNLISALENGIKNTFELLEHREMRLGNRTLENTLAIERLKKEISNMKYLLEKIK